jgi:hypothetical protein
MKTAFYPCCNRDILEPIHLLSGYVDKIIFCDINPRLKTTWNRSLPKGAKRNLPMAEFIVGDAKEVCSHLLSVDVLFYRRDSTGEGGSALFVLGDMFLRPLLEHFPSNGGLIFTDGSNSRGGNFKRMIRRNGLVKHGWKFSTTPEQPYIDAYGLWRISVSPHHEPTNS